MSEALYQQAIKDLARAAHGAGRLAAADGKALLDNPFCGDRVAVEIARRDGRIAAIAHETRGCLLCRAAASILGLRAVGHDAAGIAAAQAALRALLAGAGAAPSGWPEFAVFVPARAHSSRHGCVLLPFAALAVALAQH